MQTWKPSYVNMCSYDADCAGIRERHAYILAQFGATNADCEMVDLKPVRPWRNTPGPQCEWSLNIHSYMGWKVYMLHTGCYATISEWERQERWEAEQEQRAADQATGNLNAWMGYPE